MQSHAGSAKDPGVLYQAFSLVLSVLSIASLAASSFLHPSQPVERVLLLTDNLFCALFLVDFLCSLVRSENRLRYLATWGWVDLISCIPNVPFLRYGRLTRIVRILRVLRGANALRIILREMLRHKRASALYALALLSLSFVLLGSVGELQFETAPNSNIHTAEEAIWWSITTITTVGYGDFYPVTTEGRIVAVVLEIFGVGVISAFAGIIMSYFATSESSYKRIEEELADIKRMLSAR
jgi:voltage-gated potassium channel